MGISKLFIIDDDPSLQDVMTGYARILGMSSYSVSCWNDVVIDDLLSSELLVLDLNLPGEDGVDILHNLSRLNLSIPILLCTGQSTDVAATVSDIGKSYGLNCIGTLHKPFRLESFREAIFASTNACAKQQSPLSDIAQTQDFLTKNKLTQALRSSWFQPYFQPQYCLNTNAYVGLECLARLHVPDMGLIPPDTFIKEVERHELMEEFTFKMVEDSIFLLTSIKIPQSVSISFNISHSLLTERFFNSLCRLTQKYGFDNKRIILEITETDAHHISLDTKKVLAKLRLRGFSISLDDFGTGYSTIQDLTNFPVNEIKIDKQFVQSMETCKTSAAIVESTIHLAKKLGYTVVAEGAETQEQVKALQQLNCHLIQGYYYSKPVPANEIGSLFDTIGKMILSS